MPQKEEKIVSDFIRKIKNNPREHSTIDPIVSDDFTIGPKGAFEYLDNSGASKSERLIKKLFKIKKHA